MHGVDSIAYISGGGGLRSQLHNRIDVHPGISGNPGISGISPEET